MGTKHSRYPFSFVKLDKRIFILDPWRGIYFETINRELADIKEMKEGNYVRKSIGKIEGGIPDYAGYVNNLSEEVWRGRFKRAQIQSFLKRFLFEIKKGLKR